MLERKNIGILGAGSMAAALVRGLKPLVKSRKDALVASHYKREKAERFSLDHGVSVWLDNADLVKHCDVLILAVKPQALPKVLAEIAPHVGRKHLVLSIAAGIPTEWLRERLPKASIVRAMPNLPCTVGEGVTALCAPAKTAQADLDLAGAIFASVGKTVFLEEDQMDAVTGLSGSGPAFIFLIIDALADAGVKVGLARDVSLTLAAQTVLGASKLLIESGEHPGKLKDQVTSPGGTAIAGIHTLEEGGLRTTLINAVESAARRSAELGRRLSPRPGK